MITQLKPGTSCDKKPASLFAGCSWTNTALGQTAEDLLSGQRFTAEVCRGLCTFYLSSKNILKVLFA